MGTIRIHQKVSLYVLCESADIVSMLTWSRAWNELLSCYSWLVVKHWHFIQLFTREPLSYWIYSCRPSAISSSQLLTPLKLLMSRWIKRSAKTNPMTAQKTTLKQWYKAWNRERVNCTFTNYLLWEIEKRKRLRVMWMGRDGLVKQWISPLLRTGKLAQRTTENIKTLPWK